MNPFFNKYGYYEIISYLLAGIYEVLFTLFVIFFSFKTTFNYDNVIELILKIDGQNISPHTIVLFLLISLFWGMLFNELGELCKPYLRKLGRNSKKVYSFSTSKEEINTAKILLSKKLQLDPKSISDDYLFNYANAYIDPNSKSFIRKAQTLASLFRGITIYSFFLMLLLIIHILSRTSNPINQFGVIVFFLLIVFWGYIFPTIEKKYSSILHSFTIRQFIIENNKLVSTPNATKK